MNDTIALVGNPNCGKTSLFNTLTGTYQKVGNWTGVTTEQKIGKYKKDKQIKIIDLPGLYSLGSGAIDETTAYKYLKNTPPKVIINVVDGTNLERNLSLTVELAYLKIPTVIAINMCDELEKNHIKLNSEYLSKIFGVPVINVSALKGTNIDKLIDVARKTSQKPQILGYNANLLISNKLKRFDFIESIIDKVIQKKTTKTEKRTQRIDKILLNKYLSIPIFFMVMTAVYFLSMKVGGFFGGYIEQLFEWLSKRADLLLNGMGASEWITSLICDAIIKTLGGVCSFLPQILILFMLMALIEESGYASRVAFIFDRIFRTFGLSGKSLLPLIVSCGCTVTGLMATRTIENTNERRMTVFLAPFMPCGAKTAVFAWFSSTFFGGNALVATSMYFLGIICACVFGLILKGFKIFRSDASGFLLEIPLLRVPPIKNVVAVMWEKVKEFTTKAALIVFSVTVFLWLLKSVGPSGYVGEKVEKSFLFILGNILKYAFYPLGCSSWQTSVALISGTFAKEAVVESLNLLSTDVHALFNSTYSAYAFMAFILLSPPCVASLATAKRELGNLKIFAFMLIFQTLSAYIVAIIINTVGTLIYGGFGLILSVIIAIIIVLAVIKSIKRLNKNGCKLCGYCKKGEKCNKKVKRFTT
ncbi:MAG: ferrous iron transporter B [Clostridia bacterium]|nr:ferrous iron transporter B [Clostridia bacterium]